MKVLLLFIFAPSFFLAQTIDVGSGCTVLKCANGDLFVAGQNQFGQLGNGFTSSGVNQFNKVLNFDSTYAVSAGGGHILATTINRTLYGWGLNDNGQLGIGNTLNSSTPKLVDSLHNVQGISAGFYHSLVLLADSTVWAFGDNSSGELGQAPPPFGTLTPVKIDTLSKIVEISAGVGHGLALSVDGDLWVWGQNQWGQLGLGHLNTSYNPQLINGIKFRAVEADRYTTYGLDTAGAVWAWGRNINGELGVPNNGSPYQTAPMKIRGISNVHSIAVGYEFALALLQNGRVVAWGKNQYYQLGDSSTVNRMQPGLVNNLKSIQIIAANDAMAFAIDSSGIIYSWGSSSVGALASGNDTVKPVPTPVPFSACNPVIGIKDWDIPKPNGRLQVYPNPAQNSCTVSYEATGASNAYLMLTNASNGTTVLTHTLNPQQNQSQLNLSAVSAGAYLVVLVCDGQIVSSRNLQVQ